MRILFMGRKEEGAKALAWTLDQGHEVVGVLTDSHLPGSQTAGVAAQRGIPLFTYEEACDAIETGSLVCDFAVSFVYWRILGEPLLSHPPLGIINFHPAPLPDYKGTAGYNLAILEALDEWAVSAHYIDAGIDTGGIVDVLRFTIDPDEELATTLERKSMGLLLSLYKKTLRRAEEADGPLPTTPNRGGRYVARREMEAMKAIHPGDDVDRKIRAFWFPPYSGATVEVDGKAYTLVNDQILKTLTAEGSTHLRQ